MRHVLFVHGINSDGSWQNEVARVLRPHFEPVPIKYAHYRRLGALKLVLDPWVGIVLAPGFYFLGTGFGLPKWAAAVAGVVGAFLASYFAAPLRRELARKSWMKQASRYLEFGRPHIIAHSFGTYLSIWALKSIPAARARRVVLVGCVLKDQFDWSELKKRKPDAFDAVRNDWTDKDQVVRLAQWIEWRIEDFGRAGLTGFVGDASWVHNVASPDLSCASCGINSDAPVHNFDCSGLGHSDSFLGGAHAARFWLPFLWGFDPKEYGDLLDCCESAADAFENHNQNALQVAEDELLHTEWKWGNGELFDYMKSIVKTDKNLGNRDPVEIIGRANRLFWQIIERGRRAAISGKRSDERWKVFLRPEQAASEAIKQVISAP